MMCSSVCGSVQVLEIDSLSLRSVFLWHYYHSGAPHSRSTGWYWFYYPNADITIQISFHLILPVVGYWDGAVICNWFAIRFEVDVEGLSRH